MAMILQLLTEDWMQTYGRLVIWCVHFEDVFSCPKFIIQRLWQTPTISYSQLLSDWMTATLVGKNI